MKALFKWNATVWGGGIQTDAVLLDRRRTHPFYSNPPLSFHCFCLFVGGSFNLHFLYIVIFFPNFLGHNFYFLLLLVFVCSRFIKDTLCLPLGSNTLRVLLKSTWGHSSSKTVKKLSSSRSRRSVLLFFSGLISWTAIVLWGWNDEFWSCLVSMASSDQTLESVRWRGRSSALQHSHIKALFSHPLHY